MIVNGVDIPDTILTTALDALTPGPFSLRDLQTALEMRNVGADVSYEAAKRFLQRERRVGGLVHDPERGEWRKTDPAPGSPGDASSTGADLRHVLGFPGMRRKPTPASDLDIPDPSPATTMPLRQFASQREESEDQNNSKPDPGSEAAPNSGSTAAMPSRLRETLWMATAGLACAAAVLALALINASFAWQMAETETFRLAFVMGLAASDLMRPLLVARGVWDFERRRVFRGLCAMIVALGLAPVSVLSSTAVISATLHLGAEENAESAEQRGLRQTLTAEHARLKARAELAWAAWHAECDRGGCGSVAIELEETAKRMEAEAGARLDALLALSETAQAHSSFLSRSVTAFRELGLAGGASLLAIPILMALTLEVAALFGPGLLLANRRTVS